MTDQHNDLKPKTGRDLYTEYVDNSGIHCNRCAAWDELSKETQAEWNQKAGYVPAEPRPAEDQPTIRQDRKVQVSELLSKAGVFKGADGLERFLECQDFWEKQPYGTRLYFGEGGLDYLHRDVFRTAIRLITDQSAGIENLKAENQELQRKALAWEETAAQMCRNTDFYRGIVVQIGEPFGVVAMTSDDGSIQQDVLALKVPELVDQLRERVNALEKMAQQRVRLVIRIGRLEVALQELHALSDKPSRESERAAWEKARQRADELLNPPKVIPSVIQPEKEVE